MRAHALYSARDALLAPPGTFDCSAWWRLDRALDEEACVRGALVGGMEALLSGTTTLVDHHASPNAIDGSLDVIEEALSALGVRSVLCYETSDRDGPERAQAGLDENRRFTERVRREQLPLTRGLIGAHASFTLSDDTLAACAAAARELEVGLHIHAAEDAVDERDSVVLHGFGVAARLAHAGALDGRTLLAHGVHLDDDGIALVHAANASLAHNARSNMNNAIGRARLDALGPRVALGTDGIGSDMFEESRTAYFRLREDDTRSGRTGRSTASRPARRSSDPRSASAASEPSRRALPPISSSSTTRFPLRSTRGASPGTGCSPSARDPCAT
jgi:cytosine/adenosine deaminase-related metal-dependent hydrolase